MDFLAAKVDQALAAVQNFYTKLISTLGNLLIATFLDVLARMGALGKAAKRSLSHLEGKMWEYLLGVDISKPMGAEAAEGAAAEQAQASGQATDEKLTADDIEMESVEAGEMDPALVQEANLKDGESKQLSGRRDPAAIALPTALAMGLVELAMELGFKAIGKGLNKAGQAVKKGVGAAATGAKKVAGAGVKGIKSLLKSGAKLASKSGSMIIRNGKIVIKSLQKGLMKGAKKLQGLVDRILQKFKHTVLGSLLPILGDSFQLIIF
ncbi:hypothetical protein [Paenibacillus sp. sgz5001063]|uniref:hypothetical protein n=1 Tax=Paenibacillus sp. sgz5001063 TaxID=3242474 RepID=UPI0036D364FB